MAEQFPNQSSGDQDSKLGMIVILAFALGIPLVGMIVGYFTQTPK